ncbi:MULTISPECIES: CpaD family pilus assembly protein [Methylosinus]|uniref:Pilus assembly protein CpaD n=1 Tax=Methylosinus trichosporium (strain ATCC 35070 / NCIMB 11131 / UNIQEM 75 / OB3b) TaxID=595536 RepID=A0A2D2D378_METT3|nr:MULTISPECIES: CpaD family pilus assembly protein [Methylosinus]ATQ69453.1 pilus assembly protein CpaD [Methylosinus trichosporium OB3b]
MSMRSTRATIAARLPALCARAALAAAMAAPLAGCGVNKVMPPPAVVHDYRDRHPVVLADATTAIDVFPEQRLDQATVDRIQSFVQRYRRLGHGQITLLAPTGSRNTATRAGVDAVRRQLADSGVAGAVYVGTYPVSDADLAAPVRLSFQGIKAKVADRCGQWPEDLASASSLKGWNNDTHWNFGCANQATLAAQIDDPRDLASPRGETPADIESRMRALNKVRTGVDPSTKWMVKGSNISSVGGD